MIKNEMSMKEGEMDVMTTKERVGQEALALLP
jgi:hypothetical protein